MLFSAIVHKEEEIYVAECTEVGTVSQGITIEEAVENLKESTQLYLEEFPIVKKQLIMIKRLLIKFGDSSDDFVVIGK